MADDEARMTFTEHLGELRLRIIRSGWAVVIAMIICYLFSDQIYMTVKRPLDDSLRQVAAKRAADTPAPPEAPGTTQPSAPQSKEVRSPAATPRWVTQSPLEGFWVKLKLAGYVGFTLALPFVIFQFCAFIFPGLRPGEKQMMKFLLFGSGVFAIFGICVAYFVVLPKMMPYMLDLLPPDVEQQFRLNETISMLIMLLAAFAAAFQFPMAVWVLVYLGLLSPGILKKSRKIAIVVAAVLAAALTPTPDPFTMLVMLVPMVILYEVSIWVSYAIIRKRQREREAETE